MPKDRDTKLEVVIRGERHEFSSQEELGIDRDDLDIEMARQAAHYAWFGILHERARNERSKLESEIENLENRLFLEYGEKIEKITVDAKKAKVKTDARYRNLIEKFQEAEHDERLLGVVTSALSQRKDILIALARTRNLEMSTPSADEVEKIKKNLLRRS